MDRGIELKHSAIGLHRVKVSGVRQRGAATASGIELVQTFGRGWDMIEVSDVDGVCLSTLSARGHNYDLKAQRCADGGLQVDRIDAQSDNLRFPGEEWTSEGWGWRWPSPVEWSARPAVFSPSNLVRHRVPDGRVVSHE